MCRMAGRRDLITVVITFPIDFASRKKARDLLLPRSLLLSHRRPIRATPEKIALPPPPSSRPIHSAPPIKGFDEKLCFLLQRRGDGHGRLPSFTFRVRYCKVSLHNLPDLESIESSSLSSPFLFFPPSVARSERDVPLSFSDELWPLICTPSVAKKQTSQFSSAVGGKAKKLPSLERASHSVRPSVFPFFVVFGVTQRHCNHQSTLLLRLYPSLPFYARILPVGRL